MRLSGSDDAATAATQQVIGHHGMAMASRDLDQIMSDYADDAVLIDPSGTAVGKAAIRRAFEPLVKDPVPLAPPTHAIVEGEVALLLWTAEPGKPGRLSAETVLIRNGKIVAQTVAVFGGTAPVR